MGNTKNRHLARSYTSGSIQSNKIQKSSFGKPRIPTSSGRLVPIRPPFSRHHGNGYLPEDTRSKLRVIKRYENCLSYIPLYKYNYTTTTLKGSLPRIMVACQDCFNRHTCILLCPPVQLRFIKRSKLSQPKRHTRYMMIYANKHDGLRASKYRHLYISGTSAFASTVSIVTYLFLGKKPSG